jgi:hypothetical protein
LREHELPLCFGENALAQQMSGGDARRPLHMVIEPVRRHREFARVKRDMPLAAEISFDQAP